MTHEELQTLWDGFLLGGWKENYPRIGTLTEQLMAVAKHEGTYEEFLAGRPLQRMPEPTELMLPVRGFVGDLPFAQHERGMFC